MKRALPISLSLVLGACAAQAQWWEPGPTPGALVAVSVEVDGAQAPLFPAPDSSNRFYLEARARASYAVNLANRTGERLAVQLTVDGLNAISGERDAAAPGRMYVLGPWEQMTVKGWRTSLADVRQFTFVDERASYAVRSGKANGRIGWIEAAVYREQRRYVARPRPWTGREENERSEEYDSTGEARSMAPPASAPRDGADASSAKRGAPSEGSRDDLGRGSFPGTGWGPRTEDPAVVVAFEPEGAPADRITLRYEYRTALLALGVLPRPWPPRDRLRERERGDSGFAKPPAW